MGWAIEPCLTFLGALAGLLVGSDPWGGLSYKYFEYHFNESIGWIVAGGVIGLAFGKIIHKLDVISKQGRGGAEDVDDDETEDNRKS